MWEDGESVLEKRINNVNKLLEETEYEKYYDEAEQKGFLDFTNNLIRTPVKLRTKDDEKKQFNQKNLYQLTDT